MSHSLYRIAFLIYPGMTQLDFTGPAQVLHRMPGAEVAYVWKTLEPVVSDCDIAIVPTETLDGDRRFDMICVPGGFACTDMMADEEVLRWLRVQAEGADLVTSVCTGSLVLAAAGLLDGYRAGCHWAWEHELMKFGATPVRARVVTDRNRITAGGVTAGIDFAFRVIEQKCGRDVAEALQLGLEYDPEPIAGGTPDTARPEIVAKVSEGYKPRLPARFAAIAEIAERYGAAAHSR